MRFHDIEHAARIAGAFLDISIAYGTTTIAAYSTVHKQSAVAFLRLR